jgi:hypothetical protein
VISGDGQTVAIGAPYMWFVFGERTCAYYTRTAPIGYSSGMTFDGEGRRDYSGASVSLSYDGN